MRPLSRVPENALKFVVGVLLSAFGTFWVGEGMKVLLLVWGLVVPFFLVVQLIVWIARRRDRHYPPVIELINHSVRVACSQRVFCFVKSVGCGYGKDGAERLGERPGVFRFPTTTAADTLNSTSGQPSPIASNRISEFR